MGIIVSAFPGTGKSYATKNYSKKFRISDSDSSKFSWIYRDGVKTEERNPNFIDDYLGHIRSIIDENDIIFVSSHSEVRKALERAGLYYMLVFGYYTEKQQRLQIYRDRGNSQKFIDSMDEHYCEYIEGMDAETFPEKFKLHYDQFMDENFLNILINYDSSYRHLPGEVGERTAEEVNWTYIEQYCQMSPYKIKKYKDYLDIDTLYMYNKVPEDIAKTLPMNVDYMIKYQSYKGGFRQFLLRKQQRSK